MPRVTIEILEGRTLEQKRALGKEICEAIAEAFQFTTDRVAVRIIDVKFEDFATDAELCCDKSLREKRVVYGGQVEPRILIQFVVGRTLDEKRSIVKLVAERVARILDLPINDVKITLFEVNKDQFSTGGILLCDPESPIFHLH